MNDLIKKEATTIHLLPEDKQAGKLKAKKTGKTFGVYIADLIRKDTKNDK